MEDAVKRDLRNYPLYFLIWTIGGVFFFSHGLSQKFFSHDPTPWWRYLISWLVGVYLWALMMPGILWLGRRSPHRAAQLGAACGAPLVIEVLISASVRRSVNSKTLN